MEPQKATPSGQKTPGFEGTTKNVGGDEPRWYANPFKVRKQGKKTFGRCCWETKGAQWVKGSVPKHRKSPRMGEEGEAPGSPGYAGARDWGARSKSEKTFQKEPRHAGKGHPP